MSQVVTPDQPPAPPETSTLAEPTWARLRVRRMLSMALASTVMASVAVVGAAPAHAVENYPRPADGILTVTGLGWGHGHGMSQWGAFGAAKISGLSWRDIVAFYYPGTTLTNMGSTTIRVRLSAAGTGPLTVVNTPGLQLAGQALPDTTASGAITDYRVSSLPTAGKVAVEMRTPEGWTPYPSPSAQAVFSSAAVFTNSSLGAVEVVLASGTKRTYRGAVHANWATATTLTTVSVLPMESYLRSVVAVEMSPGWHPNALAAQAVAARSYANFGRATAPAGQTWDTCDTSQCQTYNGTTTEFGNTDLAVTATAGQTLTYAGEAAFTEFGAASGGWTAAGSRAYLKAQPDPYDALVPNTAHAWNMSIPAATIEARYPTIGTYTGLRIISRDANGQWGGRILSVAIDGSAGSVSLTGSAFRFAFGLKSEWFIPTATSTPVPPVPPVIQPWATTTYTPYKDVVLKQGSSGPAVVALQKGLEVTADGSFGPKTTAALVAFQGEQVLPPTGITSRTVWDRLETQDYPLIAYRGLTLQQGSKGAVVVVLQKALRVTADGDFGPKTAAAVKAVQLRATLAQSGVVSGWTWVAVEKEMPR